MSSEAPSLPEGTVIGLLLFWPGAEMSSASLTSAAEVGGVDTSGAKGDVFMDEEICSAVETLYAVEVASRGLSAGD